MILVDTSVWIDHFRSGNSSLADVLGEERVFAHPFVIGELACGNLRNRTQILADLQVLPAAVCAEHEDVLALLGDRKLWGKGLGWIDAHLLASAVLSRCELWTLDKGLRRAAAALGVAPRHV